MKSAEATADIVSRTFDSPPTCPVRGRVLHFVTGDPAAFEHTAKSLGGVEGEMVPLPITELSGEPSAEVAGAEQPDRRLLAGARDGGDPGVRPGEEGSQLAVSFT